MLSIFVANELHYYVYCTFLVDNLQFGFLFQRVKIHRSLTPLHRCCSARSISRSQECGCYRNGMYYYGIRSSLTPCSSIEAI